LDALATTQLAFPVLLKSGAIAVSFRHLYPRFVCVSLSERSIAPVDGVKDFCHGRRRRAAPHYQHDRWGHDARD
jgi:hypothetical protein